MAPRRHVHSSAAELSLTQLHNCLVNLPPPLVSLLHDIDAPTQDVIVEVRFRPHDRHGKTASDAQQSVYVGWTGMPSKRRASPNILRSSRGQDVPIVELDATLAKTWNLLDGQNVTVIIHLNPPLAHTVHIEPLTTEDWELIEMHANFLEINFLSQVRALANPKHTSSSGSVAPVFALTLHLSPTSTASVMVQSIEPSVDADAAFVKIAPDAEVVIAPKTRAKLSRTTTDNQSVVSNARRSARSSGSLQKKAPRTETPAPLMLRGVESSVFDAWHDNGLNEGSLIGGDVSICIDGDSLLTFGFRTAKFVAVSLLRPAHLQASFSVLAEGQVADPFSKPVGRIIARLISWSDPPVVQTAALSPSLCHALGCAGVVGAVVKVELAHAPTSKKTLLPGVDLIRNGATTTPIQRLKLHPFSAEAIRDPSIKFGGKSRLSDEDIGKLVRAAYNTDHSTKGLFEGALTDGMALEAADVPGIGSAWKGAIVRFDPPSTAVGSEPRRWLNGSDQKLPIVIEDPIPRPSWVSEPGAVFSHDHESLLVGIDKQLKELRSHMTQMSSVLLTGLRGSGKSAVAKAVSRHMRSSQLYHTAYIECSALVSDGGRISSIKESLNRALASAAWGAKLGGQSAIVLDDLDKLCPAEQELQVGNENGRHKAIGEMVLNLARQYCAPGTGIVLLATCESRESLHKVLTGGHTFREAVTLQTPDKDMRRQILEASVQRTIPQARQGVPSNDSRPSTSDGERNEEPNGWTVAASSSGHEKMKDQHNDFEVQGDVDFLDIAGQTDGYMPGDLHLLVGRARSEALMRVLADSGSEEDGALSLSRIDFEKALKGFTPASLRNITLQSSTTTFDSIGGLIKTRQVLLETLQYPTVYAPIFAQCPLRLRSGLLLYGYPGCGKTMLASAVAGECGLNFISVKGPEILNKYIGASEKSVRDLFERAQAARPCVLFFDEFDSIAPKRGHDSTGVTDRVVNQMLTKMDGAEGLFGVYVLAATSRPDLIDPALLRPGRLDKSLLCDFPNLDDRLDIIKTIGKKVKFSPKVWASDKDLQELAERTDGFSGADLQALISNAQLEAIHDVLSGPATKTKGSGKSARGGTNMVSRSRDGASNAPQFTTFPYGTDEVGPIAQTPSARIAEQVSIAAKLDGLKLARKRSKQAMRGVAGLGSAKEEVYKKTGGAATEEGGGVVIEWKHIVQALAKTRASISRDERQRLAKIYREFVGGRSGEMRDGQGGSEIGGRSSLM